MARFGPRNPADSEEEQKSGEGKVQARASRPCSIIINDALSIRKNMIKMIKDESMDKDFVKFLRTENKFGDAKCVADQIMGKRCDVQWQNFR
ncbi:hypothetical protein U1Q18_040369 [Sarracenia purpurea var. burkii]